jgi:serine/threonine protein kinase
MNAQSSMHPTDVALRNFSLGKVDEGTAESINSHLTRCAECQLKVAEISSDSFLGRLRDARVKPAVSLPVQSATDGSPDDKGRPQPYVQPETLPPDLAEHADYQILRELGRGGMGVVYLAHNRLMGRDEVLKVVSKHLIERKGVLERFSREIRSAARLMHPNIVHAYSAFRLGESIVFAMEYVEGLDLAKLVKTKGPLPVLHSCNFAYQAALGLQHAHEQGMVHRDIKPGNLMLSRKGNKAVVKVLDFGLAKATRESPLDGALTHQGQMLGTPDFIAPEQIRDAQSAGIQADVYSLGCTLYYLLTGAPPFAATSLYDLLQAHFSMDAAPLNLVRPEVPFELAALIAKMMAKDLNRRFQTPEEVAEALKPFFKSTAPGSPASDAQMSRPGSPRGSTQTTTSGPARAPAATGATHPMTSGRDRSEPTAAVVIWEDLIQIDRGEPAINTTEAQSPEATAPTAGGRVRRRSWRRPAILGASLFGALAMGVTLFVVTDKGRIKIVVDGRSPVVSIDGRTIRIEGLDEPITLRAGEHVLTVERGGVEVETRKFRIHRGNNPEIRIEYEPKVNDRTTPDRAKAPSIEAASTDAAPPEQTDRGDTDRRAATPRCR